MKTEGPEMLSRTHTSIHKTNTDLFKKFVLLIKINIETYKNNVAFFCIKIINKKKKYGPFLTLVHVYTCFTLPISQLQGLNLLWPARISKNLIFL